MVLDLVTAAATLAGQAGREPAVVTAIVGVPPVLLVDRALGGARPGHR